MANPWSHVLYTGVTSELPMRVKQHKERSLPGFTQKYNVTALVYFEELDGPKAAIAREKQIKGWTREKKLALIQSVNPEMRDLSEDWYDDTSKAPDSSTIKPSQNDVKYHRKKVQEKE